MDKITLTKDLINFIDNHSNQVFTRGRKFAFIPFWFELIGSSTAKRLPLGKLPKDLTDFIETERNSTKAIENVHREFPLQEKDCYKLDCYEQLKIVDGKLYNESMNGVKWNEVELNINVTLKSNKDLSDVLDSIRFLRHGAPKTNKNAK